MAPASGIIYQYHQANGGTTKNIKGIKTLAQSIFLEN